MGRGMRDSVLVSTRSFIQGNDFPSQTVAGAYQAKHKLGGSGSLLKRLNQAPT